MDEQHHFNNLQQSLRMLSATIASVGAAAVALGLGVGGLDSPPSNLHLQATVLLATGIVGAVLYTLWTLDQQLYHRLLSASVLAGLQLELRNPRLAPVHLLMQYRRSTGGATPAFYAYAVPIVGLAVAALVCTALLTRLPVVAGGEVAPPWMCAVAAVQVLAAYFLVKRKMWPEQASIASVAAKSDFSAELKAVFDADTTLLRRLIRERLRAHAPAREGVVGVVLTGGSRSGKSDVVKLLENMGHKVFHEAASKVMDERPELKRSPTTDLAGHVAFQTATVAHQLDEESRLFSGAAAKGPVSYVFLDRGTLDAAMYLEHRLKTLGLSAEDVDRQVRDLERAAMAGKRDAVFVLETVVPFPPATTYQGSTESEARRMTSDLYDFYDRFGADPIWVPLMSPGQRVQFILNALRARQL